MGISNPFKIITSTSDTSIDFAAAFKAKMLLLSPWIWNRQKLTTNFETRIANYFHFKQAIATDKGRDALYLILKALDIGKGDEVIVQAFTCEALIAPIIWRGATPIYVDIAEDFNMSAKSIAHALTKKTKAIIVQHTFGIPADLENILDICKENNVHLIEDLAHALGVRSEIKLPEEHLSVQEKPQYLGSYGIAAFTSLGQEKKISAQGGGVIFTNDTNLGAKIKEYVKDFETTSTSIAVKKLLKTMIFFLALHLYNLLSIGKGLIFIARKLGLAGKSVEQVSVSTYKVFDEKDEKKYLHRLHPLQAALADFQLKSFKKKENHRIKIVEIYNNNLDQSKLTYKPNVKCPLIRYPIRVKPEQTKAVIQILKDHNVLAGEWYKSPILTFKSDLSILKYKPKICKNVEQYVEEVINLPTHFMINGEEAIKISNAINQTLND